MITIDKGKKEDFDESELLGVKPYGNIGPGRTAEETKVVEKLKKKRATGSTSESGQEANLGKVSTAIGNFVNR